MKPQEQWMKCPDIIAVPPGLAYVCPLNEFIIAKKLDALHEVIGKKGIGYTIFNKDGQKIFLAVQKNRCKTFALKIFNHYGNEVIEIKKPFTFCAHRISVCAPPGNIIGQVEQKFANSFLVKNRFGAIVLRIKPKSRDSAVYDVLSGDELVGQINKRWTIKAVMKYPNFGVSFPVEMEVEDKVVLLAACFLIGYLKY